MHKTIEISENCQEQPLSVFVIYQLCLSSSEDGIAAHRFQERQMVLVTAQSIQWSTSVYGYN